MRVTDICSGVLHRDAISSGVSRNHLIEARVDSACLLGVNHGADAIDHILDEVLLGAAETSLVGDVVSAVVGLSVLTVDASNLDVVLVGDGVELVLLLAQLRELDVHGGAHGGAEVRRAGGDVAERRVVGELADALNDRGGLAEPLEDLLDSGTLLHRDNSELILLVDPDQEGLGVVVENATAAGPVAVQVTSLEEAVTLPKIY